MRRPCWPLALAFFWSSHVLATPSSIECLEASERAQVLRDRGELTAASELFATCSSTSCPAAVQTACIRWRQETLASMPSAVLVVRNERDEDVLGAEYSFDDGKSVGPISGHPIRLDPGTHALSVRAEGYLPVEMPVIVSQGEKERIIRVRLVRAVAAPQPGPAPAAPESSSLGYRLPLGLGLTAVAVGSLAGSFALGLGAKSELSDLEASPCGASRTCDVDTADGLRTRLLVADVLLGTAIVAGVVAAWVWFSAPKTSAARASGLRAIGTGHHAP